MEPGTKFLSLFTDDITYTASGPFQFGSYTSSPYADGRRVMWGSGADRVVKWDHDSLDVIAQYKLPTKNYHNAGDGEKAINLMNTLPLPIKFIYMLTELTPKLMDLSGMTFANSTTLAYFITAQNQAAEQGGKLYLVRPNDFIRKTLATLGFEQVLHIVDDMDEAVAKAKG